jgi:hypothetical protein
MSGFLAYEAPRFTVNRVFVRDAVRCARARGRARASARCPPLAFTPPQRLPPPASVSSPQPPRPAPWWSSHPPRQPPCSSPVVEVEA